MSICEDQWAQTSHSPVQVLPSTFGSASREEHPGLPIFPSHSQHPQLMYLGCPQPSLLPLTFVYITAVHEFAPFVYGNRVERLLERRLIYKML